MKGPITLAGLWRSHAGLRRRVDHVISVSHAVERGNDVAAYARQYSVIPNFLEDGYADVAADDEPDGLPSEPFVMYAGSLSRIKGIDALVRGHARLDPASRPPLVLIGYRGHDRLPILDRLGPDVRLITDIPRRGVAAAWRRSLMAVVPSICLEAFGIVALEAMALGRPVIASRIGGLGELVAHEETGVLVPPGSSSALSEAIDRLARDEPLRAALGTRAQAASTRYREDRVVSSIESVYRSVAA